MDIHYFHHLSFAIVGRRVWITGQENEQFGRFWQQCHAGGLFQIFQSLRAKDLLPAVGQVTNSPIIGASFLENQPTRRSFYYWIAAEAPLAFSEDLCRQYALEKQVVPAAYWAIFPCAGPIPESIMRAEMYAMEEWLPASRYQHAGTVEMEVYPPDDRSDICSFWLPIRPKEA